MNKTKCNYLIARLYKFDIWPIQVMVYLTNFLKSTKIKLSQSAVKENINNSIFHN